MRFHIVGNSETVDDLLRAYDLTIDELKNENKHIRTWDYLIPGMKLKIPVLSESVVDDINTIEPFIEDYYPKIKLEEQFQEIEESNYENFKIEDDNIIVEQTLNSDNTITETIEKAMENKNEENIDRERRQIYRYPYIFPYCFRPVIYVIPRNKKD